MIMTLHIFLRLNFFILIFCLTIFKVGAHELTLEQALLRAWSYSPAMNIATSVREVKEAEQYQASRWPNPIAAIEMDGANNIGKSRKNAYNREVSYTLSQLFELGGKRRARKQEAAFEASLATYEMESIKLDLYKSIVQGFVDVKAAQEYVNLAQDQQRIAEEVYSVTTAKVQGGKLSSLPQKKADLNRITTSLALEKALRALGIAKKRLALIWGSTDPDFKDVLFALYDSFPPEDLSFLISEQCKSLTRLQWDMQIGMALQVIAGEKAQRIPDLVVTAGYVNCPDDGDGLLLGFSFPIPVFDQNQGNICRAKHLLNILYEKKNEDLLQLRMDLEDAYAGLLTAYKESVSYRESLLPSAKNAFEAAQEEFRNGKNDYLELLDAQRTYFDVQAQYISTLVDYHYQQAEVKRLLGIPLSNICRDQLE